MLYYSVIAACLIIPAILTALLTVKALAMHRVENAAKSIALGILTGTITIAGALAITIFVISQGC